MKALFLIFRPVGVSRSFICIGVLLIFVGILTSITVLTIPHLYFAHWHYGLTYLIFNPVIFMTLTLTISGLMTLSNSGSTWRSFGLFILSFVILGSCIFMLFQMSDQLRMTLSNRWWIDLEDTQPGRCCVNFYNR
jgi:hypothetical protein